MKRETNQLYIVVFEDESEYLEWLSPSRYLAQKTALNICEDAVRTKKLVTNRKNPQKVAVELFAAEVINGELERRKVGRYEVMPPFEPMNEEEYNEELAKAIENLPLEFRNYVSRASWERGHSAGYEEVVNIAQEMAYDLSQCIQQYHSRMIFSSDQFYSFRIGDKKGEQSWWLCKNNHD